MPPVRYLLSIVLLIGTYSWVSAESPPDGSPTGSPVGSTEGLQVGSTDGLPVVSTDGLPTRSTDGLPERSADDPTAGSSWREVVSPRTRVLFADPALEEYATGVAARAEEALDVLNDLFGSVPEPITIRLDAATDLYSAIAPPLPRPTVVIPALFPAIPQVDLAARDPLYALLLHELTHAVQLRYRERPSGVAPLPELGIVGEEVVPFPPGWLLEGLAVWVAGTYAPGAAVEDARTGGVLQALALDGEWPSLEELSLLSHSDWPGGEARYLLGGAFVGYLAEEYGWETLLASLREANAGWYPTPFETAWQRAAGESLEAAWEAWSGRAAVAAASRAAALPSGPSGVPLTSSGAATEIVAVDPSGNRVAWRPAGGGLVVSRLSEGRDGSPELIGTQRLLPPHRTPLSLDWPEPDRLVYTGLAPGADDRFIDLFGLDPTGGREVRLTSGARARFARGGPQGCAYYVRDVAVEGSRLMKFCSGEPPKPVFEAAPRSHIVGLAVSDAGRIVLSIWRAGQVDLALLEAGRLRLLTEDPAQDLDPAWRGEQEIVFRSDRAAVEESLGGLAEHQTRSQEDPPGGGREEQTAGAGGVFELYSLRLGDEAVRRLSASIGGAFSPVPAGQRLVYARLGGEGLELAASEPTVEVGRRPLDRAAPPGTPAPVSQFPVAEYEPLGSLAPFGWLPAVTLVDLDPLRVRVSATLLGQDRSGDHSYAVTAGYDPTLPGYLGGAWVNARYDYRRIDAFDIFQRPAPSGFGVRFGLWPHIPHLPHPGIRAEVAAGFGAEAWWRRRLRSWLGLARLEGGLVLLSSHGRLQPEARLDLIASRRYSDLWGYGTSGPRLSAHLLWSASPAGGSPAAWLDASLVLPAGSVPFTTSFAVRGGYRTPPPVPLTVRPVALFGTLALRDSYRVQWRYADGLLALERLTLEGRLHAGFDGAVIGAADLSLWADTMIRYGAPVSLGATAGYAEGWWYRVGLRLPL